jgi:hypothetical protein
VANRASCAGVEGLEFEVARGRVVDMDPGGSGGGGGGGGGAGKGTMLMGRFESYNDNNFQKTTISIRAQYLPPLSTSESPPQVF